MVALSAGETLKQDILRLQYAVLPKESCHWNKKKCEKEKDGGERGGKEINKANGNEEMTNRITYIHPKYSGIRLDCLARYRQSSIIPKLGLYVFHDNSPEYPLHNASAWFGKRYPWLAMYEFSEDGKSMSMFVQDGK